MVQGRVGPGGEVAAVEQVAQDDPVPALAGDAAGAAAVSGVCRGEYRSGEAPVPLSGMGHHADPPAAPPGVADPREAVAAHLDQVGAEGVEEGALIHGTGEAAVAAGEDGVGSAQAPQVLLRLLALGAVPGDADQPHHPAFGVGDGDEAGGETARRGRTSGVELELGGLAGEGLGHQAPDPVPVLRAHEVQVGAPAHGILAVRADLDEPRRVHGDQATVGPDGLNAQGRLVEEGSEAVLVHTGASQVVIGLCKGPRSRRVRPPLEGSPRGFGSTTGVPGPAVKRSAMVLCCGFVGRWRSPASTHRPARGEGGVARMGIVPHLPAGVNTSRQVAYHPRGYQRRELARRCRPGGWVLIRPPPRLSF